MPSRLNALESLAEVTRLAKRPNRYSVLSSRPSKVRVISTRPWTSSARRVELIDFACGEGQYWWSEVMDLKSVAGDLTWIVLFGAMKLSKKRFCRVNSSLCVKFFSPLSSRVMSILGDSSLDAR